MKEDLAKLQEFVDLLYPKTLEKVSRGKSYRPYLYLNCGKISNTNKTLYKRDEENVKHICVALVSVKNGASLRQAADYVVTHTGSVCSYQQINNEFAKLTEFLPKWEQTRKKHHGLSGKNNSLSFQQPKEKRDKIRTQMKLRKQIRENEQQLKCMALGEQLQEGSLSLEDYSFVPTKKEQTVGKQEKKVVFEPNPGPQNEFLASTEMEVLFGGAAGGGKSYAMLVDPLRYVSNGNFNGLLLRRRSDELRELIWKSQELYNKIFKGAKWSERKSQWTFPSGARLWFTYLDRDSDVLRYQGQAFTWIGFDELTQHPSPFVFDYMRSRLRSTDPSLPLCMRATTNPGGPGHGWVKQMFIDPAPPNSSFTATNIESGKELVYPEDHSKAGQALFKRKFIPATLKDNPYLYNDGMYEANLLSLPEQQRRQLLRGDWTIADGAAFPEFNTHIHVTEPFEIPSEWRKFRSCDFGYSSFSAVHWYAVDPNFNVLYVYRELYVSKHTAKDLAMKVIEIEKENHERMSYGVLDSSTWHKRGHTGPSIAEEMIILGCKWRPSDRTAGSRVASKNRLHELLKVEEETEKPGIIFFNNCRQIIADMQVIPVDPKGSDDIDGRFTSDHAYDSIRYGIQSRPKPLNVFDFGMGLPKEPEWKPFDPVFGY